ncbi:MAG: flagellar filament capping protein FliD [Betaproteobacteria bacterium]|nr:flagellar filament capping protein FliD [Betaproteobacteria bacterium]
MALSAPGIGSNLDVNGIVSQIMALERRPLTVLDTKEAKYQAQLTAYGSQKGALSSFQSAVAALASPARFSAVTASFADTTVATATASSAAAAGSYSVEVQTLAQSHKLKSATFAATSTTVGTGTLTIRFGTYSGGTFTLNPDQAAQTISVDASESSLAGVRDAINTANAGVSASIVNDGSGNRLIIASKDTGVANALKITVEDDDLANTDNAGLSQLAYDASTGGTTNLTQTFAAQNATAVIDGIAITKASNTISDAIEGVTLNLLKANTPSATTLTVTRDTAGIQAAVQSFVTAYNDLNKIVTDLSKYDAANKRSSTLTGDATVRSVQTQLRGVFNTTLSTAGGGLTALSNIGISFQKDGTLKLDSSKLTTALSDSTKDVSTLFAAVGKPTDSLVSFVSSTSDTKNGTYLLNVSQLSTQGKAVGGGAAVLTINAASNDTIDLTVDGVAASVTLAAGTYSVAELAAEIQSKINGVIALSSTGISVTVTQSAGVLSVTSNRYGSASTVAITGGTGKSDLFGAQTETAGVNVAGTIGGITATGSGQILTGTGDASGLALKVTGGATDARGTVSFARGYAYELDKLVEKMLEDDSLVDGRMDGINASIKNVGTQREVLARRLDMVESRYRAQFTALDVMMSSMSNTSSFLQQQLENLPKAGDWK